MSKLISTPTISKILNEEFLKPLDISAYRLAKDIAVPVSRIQDILKNKRKITADTSLRFAKYFNVSDDFFLNIQTEIDIRNEKIKLESTIQNIHPVATPVIA